MSTLDPSQLKPPPCLASEQATEILKNFEGHISVISVVQISIAAGEITKICLCAILVIGY